MRYIILTSRYGFIYLGQAYKTSETFFNLEINNSSMNYKPNSDLYSYINNNNNYPWTIDESSTQLTQYDTYKFSKR